ncbi:eukaryotic translation initiation factor 3 subunit J [Aspergillus ruber CBS 135680]|uniref:Eukaryotic translation initiation factor 3 subunit J n=1 Tax=Aspergillus ruber (strain CBS 135680) TaxID=1388766 RepID=A0A017ST76_ASPRC|nr:translation initiation factor eIF3 subunit [Aspergillus ruber CBS 135680]EYE99480.1 translation initiation factor eIF3 subunit [Aspergillus ruber CBS 135680]
MPPSKWDDEEESTSPPPPVLPRRNKFDDEEEEEVLDSWDAAEDSDVEREKEAKAAEAKAKAEAEAAANKKSKNQRIEEHKQIRRKQAEEEQANAESDEDESSRRERLRRTEKDSDLAHAEDLFGGGGGAIDIGDVDMQRMKNRSAAPKPVMVSDSADPTNAIDLSAMPLFKPTSKEQFSKVTSTLGPMLTAHSKKPHYALWAQDFAKQLVKDLPSGEIKKIASALTTASNEKMREERAADKGNKKSKAAKTKVSLAASREDKIDSNYDNYDDGLGDDDFM